MNYKLHFILTNLTILFAFAIVYTLLPKKTFNVEKQLSFVEALYFSTTTHTTVGFGDIYPVTTSGRLFIMLHALLIFATVANYA